jgi:outer membrane protein
LQTKVNKTIEEIAKDQNFDLIMYQGVAYASPKIDITDQIIKALGK